MYEHMRHMEICILVGWRGINRDPAELTAASYRSISHYKKKFKKTQESWSEGDSISFQYTHSQLSQSEERTHFLNTRPKRS